MTDPFELRDKALADLRAQYPEYTASAIALIRALSFGWAGLGEKARLEVVEPALGPPPHPNLFGAIWQEAARMKLIATDQTIAPPTDPKSKASPKRLWVRTRWGHPPGTVFTTPPPKPAPAPVAAAPTKQTLPEPPDLQEWVRKYKGYWNIPWDKWDAANKAYHAARKASYGR